MEEDLAVSVCVATQEKSIPFMCKTTTTAEGLCGKICSHLQIAPIAKTLFSIRLRDTNIFLANNAQLGKDINFDFRIRYRVPSLKRLKHLDSQSYNYYFHQVRNDVLDNRIPEIIYTKHRDELLGLGITDMYRVMKEESKTSEELEKDYKKYIPREVIKKHLIFTKKPIHNTLEKIKKYPHDAGSIKDMYLKKFYMMAPNYLSEDYKVVIANDEGFSDGILHVIPFHRDQPGLRIYFEFKKEWEHLCTIDELCFMSIRNDGTVEISRKNGIPIYIKFNSVTLMLSFVSVCDGYYRLMIKWTFNLCKDVTSPALEQLHSMRCHGPVGGEFSYHKLSEKRANKTGCFILRQCEQKYDTYYIDVCPKNSKKPETYKIEKVKDFFVLHDESKSQYRSIAQLIAAHNLPDERIFLQECLPPSEYDKSQLLLCEDAPHGGASRVDRDDIENLLTSSRGPHCINTKDLLVFKGTCVKGSENVSFLYRAIWNVAQDKKLEVAMKVLKHDTSDKYMKDFIDLAGQWAFLQTTSIVRLYGITLRSPVAMIMEYLRYGPLDVYLREKKKSIQAVELVEAASSLATALWHMSESRVVHGNIRCRKMLVASHDSTHFSVKLCDPGLHTSYADNEIHWMPTECLNNADLARLSPIADVWAFATTLWEIFSYGMSPAEMNPTLTKKSYFSGNRLYMPSGCPSELFDVMKGCWLSDPHQRSRPQVIMRDVNHLLYQVFNSRRTHAYATVFPKSFKESSACSLQSNLTSESCLDSNLLLASDIERDSMRSISSSFSGGHTTMTNDFDYTRDDDITSCDLSTILSNLQFPSNLSSIDSMQCIFELGADCNVVLQGRIGQGFYGEVYKGTLEREDDSESIQVAVKKLKLTAQVSQLQDFEREISIMKKLKHPNIVEILGVVEEPEVQLIMEYVRHGSLQCYLKIYRHTITAKQLLIYALNVAMGMEYLGNMHVVHRDLATRNILVVSEDHVKISDFGLAQVMNKGDYYILKTERNLPLKWYAPESVNDGKFSSRSDVWSYGVTLWEMFSFGEEPPWGNPISHERQSRLVCPAFCPPEVYARLLLICWEMTPTDRPTFTELIAVCRDLLTQF